MSEFVTPKKVIQFCTDILKDYCVNIPNPVFITNEESNPERYYLQGGKVGSAEGAQKNLIPIVLLKTGQWIHFGIEFERDVNQKNYKYRIKSVTLQLLEDKEGKTRLIFRAEWDNIEIRNNNHPQPHWHFQPQTEYILDDRSFTPDTFNEYLSLIDNNSGFNPNDDETTPPKIKNIQIRNFHFAMSANWHNGSSNVPRINLTESNLKEWLLGCLKSIMDQIEYCLS